MQLGNLSRVQLYGIVSSACFAATILNAFRVRSNFYAAAVYLSKSNACMMIIWQQAIYMTVLFGKLMQAIFFGDLRMIERERLQERGWFAVTETLLALTIFKDEFESSFVLLFVSLLFLKVFHWLASDRVEMMEQSAQVTRLAHARMLGLLSILWTLDTLLILFAVESILFEGPTVMIMFASEYMILLANVWTITMKYILNCIDLRSEVPWEDKSIYGLYVDLAADFFKLLNYITFFSLILTFYGLPLNILRDVYITLRSFILKCRDLARYRAATRNMDTLYPDATLAVMEAMQDKTCIICREDMEFRGERPAAEGGEGEAQPEPQPQQQRPTPPPGPNDTPKKLPCGHVFHFHCLRSWLERQQSCPTCRRPVLPSERGAAAGPPPGLVPVAGAPAAAAGLAGRGVPAPAVGDEAIRQAQLNLARNLGREAFGVVFPGIPFPAEAEGPAGAAPPLPAAAPAAADPAAPGIAAPPSASTSRRPSRQPPSPTPASGAGHDNPLARFSLPELRLPPTGEAGLYSAAPGAAPSPTAGFAGVGYGLYHPGGQAAAQQQARSLPNLEERIKHIRERMARAQGGSSAPSVGAPMTSGEAGRGPSVTVTPTSPPIGGPEVSVKEPETSGTGETATSEEVAGTGEVKPELSAREAALAAAERRAAASSSRRTKPSPTSSGAESLLPATAPVVGLASTPAVDEPQPTPVAATSPAAPTSPTSTSSPPTPVSHAPPAPVRLIPLFSSPSSTTSYPNLLSTIPAPLPPSPYSTTHPRTLPSVPFLPAEPTAEQLDEMARLTRRGMEERLRVLVGWQARMEGLATEMRGVLESLPLDSEQVEKRDEGKREQEAREQEGQGDKGKRPVEGIHAHEVS